MLVKEYDTTYAVSAYILHNQKRYISPGDMAWWDCNEVSDNLTIATYDVNGERVGPYAVERVNEDYSRVSEVMVSIGDYIRNRE